MIGGELLVKVFCEGERRGRRCGRFVANVIEDGAFEFKCPSCGSTVLYQHGRVHFSRPVKKGRTTDSL